LTEQHCKDIADLQAAMQTQFSAAAESYLRTGLDLLHSRKASAVQASIGNLAVAAELMLKAHLASLALDLLFVNLPLDLRVMLADLESLPESVKLHRWLLKLRSGAYKTSDFDTSVNALLARNSDAKIPSKTYLRRLIELRNSSLHGLLPEIAHYEQDRAGYTAIGLYKALADTGLTGFKEEHLTADDLKLLADFPKERLERFQRKLADAQGKAAALTEPATAGYFSGWEEYPATCPVCGSEGKLSGYAEEDVIGDPKWEGANVLTFFADGFKCAACDLVLEDDEELRLAGLQSDLDISDQLPYWWDEKRPAWRHEFDVPDHPD
jgi:hypothetical protein